MNKVNKSGVPALRFPEFKNALEWQEKKLGDVSDVRDGTHDSPKFYDNGKPLITSKNLLKNGLLNLNNVKFISNEDYQHINNRSKVDIGDILFGMIGTIGNPVMVNSNEFAIKNVALIKQQNLLLNNYLVHFLNSQYIKTSINALLTGNTQKFISLGNLRNIKIPSPNLKEQQKIADCLTSLDDLITAQSQKVDSLKQHKKGLMQQLFPAKGKNTPALRFPEFKNAPAWQEKKLGDYLDYLQPTKYLVESTAYNDDYKTPVLTAGKTFILGYTNETDGILENNLPVVIFDDFTTATKFVDFPFKAKSSAMKILLAKDNTSIKFMYELMQMIGYEIGNHQRHWISKFSMLNVFIPKPKEQQKIAECLTSLDELIDAQSQKMAALKQHKKGLMQQLFPVAN